MTLQLTFSRFFFENLPLEEGKEMKRIVAALAIALFVGAGLYVGGAIVYSPTAAADPN
jgi:hypothetical protein